MEIKYIFINKDDSETAINSVFDLIFEEVIYTNQVGKNNNPINSNYANIAN